jgi:hypothetical protein
VEKQHIPYLEVPTGAQTHHDTAPEASTLTIIQPMQSNQVVCFKENKVPYNVHINGLTAIYFHIKQIIDMKRKYNSVDQHE